MTIIIPEPNVLDKILKCLGKRRGVFIPTGLLNEEGVDAYLSWQKEGFLNSLSRPKGEDLPEGTIDIFSLNNMKKEEQYGQVIK